MDGENGGAAGLAKQCRLSCLSFTLQVVVAILFVFSALWSASLLLEPLNLTGITTVPPGIKYVNYDTR